MTARDAWPSQSYLDGLRPEHETAVRLALFSTYSADVSVAAATLLALIGCNSDKGSGSAADFAEAVNTMRDKARILVQRGRITRPKKLPKIAGILDQFIIEQNYDEARRSWHPKIALVAYDNEAGPSTWKLWIGSRNLTRSRDLDVGILIHGRSQQGKRTSKLPGIGELAKKLVEDAGLSGASRVAEELEKLWWDYPPGYKVVELMNGLGDEAGIPMEPPKGKLDSVTIVSPFLCPAFLKAAQNWGPDNKRTIVSTTRALADMAQRSSQPLKGFSRILCYQPPEISLGDTMEETATAEPFLDDELELDAPSLHAKLFSFDVGKKSIVRIGSANATKRAWSGRNAEIMIEIIGNEEFRKGLDFLVGKAQPITIDRLQAIETSQDTAVDRLEETRQKLVAEWQPCLHRESESFTLVLKAVPKLRHAEHRLKAGLANADLQCWPKDSKQLHLGKIPLPYQSEFIQVQISESETNLSWLQRVSVIPKIDDQRDDAALARHMGPRTFYEWMRTILAGNPLPEDGSWDDDPDRSHINQAKNTYERLTLEDILVGWARDNSSFARADRHFHSYVEAILKHDEVISETEKSDLTELAAIWKIARDQLMS